MYIEFTLHGSEGEMHSSCEIALQEYFLNVYQMHKNEEAAGDAVDKAIDAARRSIQLNGKSADAHGLFADLYGRKIS